MVVNDNILYIVGLLSIVILFVVVIAKIEDLEDKIQSKEVCIMTTLDFEAGK